jgi:NTE family protein
MANMSRFAFDQGQFDLMCSDLSQFRIADATAASSALPLLLSPITVKNYAGTCGFQLPPQLAEVMQMPGQQQRIKEELSYLDQDRRPYVHLLDGGLADNIGMRNVLDALGPRVSTRPKTDVHSGQCGNPSKCQRVPPQ